MVTDNALLQLREDMMHPITAIVCVVFMIIIVIRWGRIFIQMHRSARRPNTKDCTEPKQENKVNKTLMMMLATVGLLVGYGCGEYPTMKDQLNQIGLLETHELRRIEQTAGIDGHISGSSGMFGGSFDGNITSERKLQFYWGKTADEFISTTLPYSMFRFIIDETKQIPTVEFVFDEAFLSICRSPLNESEKVNLNDWFKRVCSTSSGEKQPCLKVVIVRISLTDFEKGVYLRM